MRGFQRRLRSDSGSSGRSEVSNEWHHLSVGPTVVVLAIYHFGLPRRWRMTDLCNGLGQCRRRAAVVAAAEDMSAGRPIPIGGHRRRRHDRRSNFIMGVRSAIGLSMTPPYGGASWLCI
jgi:hypothetical protein